MRYVLLVLFLCLGGSAPAAPIPPAAPKPARKPAGPDYQPTGFLGRVEFIGPDKVTLKPERNPQITWVETNSDGSEVEVFYVQDNTQPPKTFTFSDRLLTLNGVVLPRNRVWNGQYSRGEHRISDVRVGDLIYVDYGTLRGQTLCSWIAVLRRPGGRVPDAYGDDNPDYKLKSSTERNAEQFIEETVAGRWVPRLRAALKK